MSEQDGAQASTKRRRSRPTSKQNGSQVLAFQRPANDNKEAWIIYWKEQGRPWCTEPEIDKDRQQFLAERRSITPNIEQNIYPFKDIKLSRADIEWLLATHENGRGPIDWNDESKRERKGLDLRGANLRHVNLSYLPLALLQGGLNEAEVENAPIKQIREAAISFEFSSLKSAHLEGAILRGAALWRVDLRGADLYEAHLEYADLRSVLFDETSTLRRATLGDAKHQFARVADVRWGGINLAVVRWPGAKRAKVLILGDEHFARQQEILNNHMKNKELEIYEYDRAVRANRQLARALLEQGLNELAVQFAYRAQVLQRKVFRLQGMQSFKQYLFSLFLDLLAGFGYKPGRSFIAYAFVICLFATIYHLLGTHLAWNEAIVISMTAFHGRGFFPDQFHPGDLQALVAAIEAFVGLLIEVTFIATLTQRLFGK